MGKSQPKVKASTAQSAFDGTNNFTVNNTGFGSATSTKTGDTINTTTNLDSSLQGIANNAKSGLASNGAFLNQSPDQQYQNLNAGNNSYYNLLAEQQKRQNASDLGAAQMRYSKTGMENSLSRGAYEAQLAGDQHIADLNNQQAAMGYQNQQALASGNFNQALLAQLYGYQQDAGATTNQNLYDSFNAQDTNARFNAQQLQSASQANAQIALQQAQQRQQMIGQLVNAAAMGAATVATGGLAGPLAMASMARRSGGGMGGNLASLGSSNAGMRTAASFGGQMF